MANLIFSAILQVLLFTIIPFVWWLIAARKKESFFAFLGFKKFGEEGKKNWWYIPLAIVVTFAVGQLAVLCRGDLGASSQFVGMGTKAIPGVLVYAFVQTSLSEEILFRGFLLKRIQAKCGFMPASIITAVVFGLVHLTMIWNVSTVLQKVIIAVYPMFAAMVLAWVNEKKFKGSIFPSWIIHGTLNTLEGIIEAL